jgi:hypothetical protein
MVFADPTSLDAADRALDAESAVWVQSLSASGPAHNETLTRLHELLVRVARAVAVAATCPSPGHDWGKAGVRAP